VLGILKRGNLFNRAVLGRLEINLKKNFKKSFGKRKRFLPLQPATEVTTKGKQGDRDEGRFEIGEYIQANNRNEKKFQKK
jgi:hypothetical protein